MLDIYTRMPNVKVRVDFGESAGVVDFKKHSSGIGGVNPLPMSGRMIEAAARLKPAMIRIFIQEFFFIEKGDGELDFAALDKYMDAVAATGADIMASVCIKPPSLYPAVDEAVWRPNDVGRWQHIIGEMVKRYSVDRQYVTHWGVGNEINIGEAGGCPYKIGSASDYFEYYKMTVEPILDAFPGARVGGPSWAGIPDDGNAAEAFFEEFVRLCAGGGVQLDFICYNVYSDDPAHHVRGAARAKKILEAQGAGHIGIYVTEMNIGIGNEISIEEKAHSAKRAAGLGAVLFDLHQEAGFINTFQYHLYDQFCDPNDFKPFFARHRYMANHWNDEPHRLGLLDGDGAPRPQYFLYSMLYAMAKNGAAVKLEAGGGAGAGANGRADGKAGAGADAGAKGRVDGCAGVGAGDGYENVRVMASYNDKLYTLLAINYSPNGASEDFIMSFYFKNAREGLSRLKVHRLDGEMRWDGKLGNGAQLGNDAQLRQGDNMRQGSDIWQGSDVLLGSDIWQGGGAFGLAPSENRLAYVHEDFWFSVYAPADSVTMITLEYE
ncbi:MAG: hypothetical protein FWH01_11370 [Oscillospiraceae bacterium]|nr:hypothetical protein [Oscillospiraceae bacterium]